MNPDDVISWLRGSGPAVDPKAAQTALDQGLEKARTDLAQAQTTEAEQAAQYRIDEIANAKNALAVRQQQANATSKNADSNAVRADAATKNADTNAGKASETADYHNRSLTLRDAADKAIRDYHAALIDQKASTNSINAAKAKYQHQMALITAQINQLKDEMTANTSLDTNADTGSVTQADERNKDALTAANAAEGQVSSPDMIKYGAFAGNPGAAAGAAAGLMQAGQAFSNASGGAPVDPQQLALEHKMQIADLVLHKGVSFADALSTVAGPGQPPEGQAATVPPGYTAGNPAVGGAMGDQGFAPGAGQ